MIDGEEEFEQEEDYYMREADGDPDLAKRMEDSDIHNQGIYAGQEGSYWEAMHHFNRCLEREPEPLMKFLCLYNLGATIEQQFNFYLKGGGETGTDEEVAWSIRRGICGEQAVKVFEENAFSNEDLENIEELYQGARSLLNSGITWGATMILPNGEPTWRDLTKVKNTEMYVELGALREYEKEYWANTSVK